MTNASRDFVLAESAGSRAEDVLLSSGAGPDSPGWSDGGPSRTWRRIWLDTFDWRLYRAGLTLEQTATGGDVWLVLTGRDGAEVAAERLPAGVVVTWPSLLPTLPAGPVRELLEPVVGVRALAPVARATSRLRELRALNGDGKTVARLRVDRMAVTYPARAAARPRLTLLPVRGYQGQAERLARSLADLPEISIVRESVLEQALAAAGRHPGILTGKAAAAPLTSAMAAAAAMAAICTSLLDSMQANVPGTMKDTDSEFLHDLRISVRWTRSAIKLCGGALPDGLARRFRPEFRWLGDLTTPTRDLDVYLLGFDKMSAGLVGATQDELEPFRAHLRAARAQAHAELCRGLRSARFGRLTSEWRTALGEVRTRRSRPTAAELARAQIRKAVRRVLRTGQLITAASPPASLHDLRKRCKELRYLVEMFGSLHDPAQHWQAVRELKSLQDCLGEFQDAQVQREEVHAFAEQMLAQNAAPAATLLAMGEIAAGLALRQRHARGEFDGRFASFASPASQDLLAELTRTAAE